ncbi:endonuclease MutS2 [Vagococcus coleopterorum]|uniref:Endonuclease MutS2 n=1 Tax=Vagococcus coleopterorum TaxID=2714946 RepID=A0A6G8AL55_9ENTE|nr:endonuclease MutS2 [Vagococcus coleopterorum]QIL45692.1 endonuclease MutS2 [Vagococcus coleopterorum]
MNPKILKTLEFEKIKQQLTEYTVTALGQEEVQKLSPVTDQEVLTNWLSETEDGATLLRIRGGIPVPKLENIGPHMKRIEMGADLNGLELAQVGRVLQTTAEVIRFFDDIKDAEIDLKRLFYWADQMETVPALSQRIRESVEPDGRLTDEASPELKNIRVQTRRTEQTIREQLDGLVRGKNAKYLSDALVTMRNDRYVLPVKSEYRSVFGGVVHDQSSSGQTLFVEPKQVVELNNKLRQLQISERQEVERILAEISAEIEPHRYEIIQNAYVLGKLDFINAKAQFGKSYKGVIPKISEEKHVELKQARHPLIDPDVVVANDIFIGEEYQAILVTGPNTGGKTITLKTLGLLQLMAQAGLPITAGEDSQVAIFNNIFADIGDEQSIEQNLSTFSSHMTNIVDIIAEVDQDSLVLFDELGAGTDPQEGAALAISILDEVGAKGAYVMATTHYPELKVYGYNRVGTINASMEFNVDSLRPTYKLLIGVPGRSNAFEISKRLGLDGHIIESAKQMIDGDSQDLNDMIADLESHRKMAETEYLEVRHHVDEASRLHADLENAYGYFFEAQEKELDEAKAKANEIIREAQEKAETIITDLREKQKALGKNGMVKEHELIAARTGLNQLKHEESHLKKNKVLQKAKEQKKLKAGDDVKVESYGQRGTLLKQLSNGDWQVQLGILKMVLPESDLTLLKPEKVAPQKPISTMKRSSEHVQSQLDLRGMRYEDALESVDRYLDAALLAGYSQVTIVHGKGTGVLREAITTFLKKHRSVKSFELAPQSQGGTGATIAYFK